MTTFDLNQPEKNYHHGDLRNALLQAGLTVLAERGVDGLTLREVARRAGVSHAAPYRHFADKEALLAAIAEDGFQRLGQQITTPVTMRAGTWTEKVYAAGANYIQFAIENRDAFRLMFSHVIAHRDHHPALYVAAKRGFLLLQGLIEEGQAAGEFGSDDGQWLSQSVWAMVHGLATLMVENQLDPAAEKPRAAGWQEASIAFHMKMVTASLQKKV